MIKCFYWHTAFVSPWKLKVLVKAIFGVFWSFSTDGKVFHVHFFPPFHGQSKVFTDTCLDFFHGWIFFSLEGNSECLLIFTEEIFLTLKGFILTNLGFKEVVLYLKYAVVQEGLGIVCGLNKLIFYWSIFSSKRKLRQS